jgi:glucose-1-phosphate adenylyltransferase
MAHTREYVLAVVLAGGEGQRLMPLTRKRAKPAIPFAGKYRLIDFVLTNLVHSNLLRINVLTQYQSHSLISHLTRGWTFSAHLGQYCEVIPANSGEGYGWYLGSADALFKNLETIEADPPKIVAVFGADHIYRMDIHQMLEEHVDSKADVSVSVVPYPREEAHQFGCLAVDNHMRVTGFLEKPADPPPFPEKPEMSLVSMGNYLFNFEVLREMLVNDHANEESRHDIGGDIFPRWYDKVNIHAYNFLKNRVPGISEQEMGYWRDVGSISSYWRTSMDMVSVSPVFNLYNPNWPILTSRSDDPPAKFVFADRETKRIGIATDSLVSSGCIISGGQIDRCVLSRGVRVNSFASISESVLFRGVEVGRRCEIRRAIIDKDIQIPADTVIGYDEEEDRARGITVTEDGIRVVPPETRFDL